MISGVPIKEFSAADLAEQFGFKVETIQRFADVIFSIKGEAEEKQFSEGHRKVLKQHIDYECNLDSPFGDRTRSERITAEKEVPIIPADHKMTVKEVAEVLEVSQDTIRRSMKEVYPGLAENGKVTWLTEEQVTAIKLNLRKTAKVVKTPKTQIEKQVLIQQAMALQQELIDELKAKNAALQPRAQFADRALLSPDVLSLEVAAKVLKLGYGRTLFCKKLHEMSILQANTVPYQKYIDAGYFVVDIYPIRTKNGERIIVKPKVTVRGIFYLADKLPSKFGAYGKVGRNLDEAIEKEIGSR